MGVYEGKVGLSLRKAKQGVLALFIILLLATIAWAVLFLFNPQAIQASFESNPWEIPKNPVNELRVKVTNITTAEASSVILEVSSRSQNLKVFPGFFEFNDVLAVNDSRLKSFRVEPASGSLLPGTYTFDIQAVLNGEAFTHPLTLEIK